MLSQGLGSALTVYILNYLDVGMLKGKNNFARFVKHMSYCITGGKIYCI